MPLYLTRFSYTSEAWAKLIKEPEDRRETIAPLLEAAGGKLHGLWYAFGAIEQRLATVLKVAEQYS